MVRRPVRLVDVFLVAATLVQLDSAVAALLRTIRVEVVGEIEPASASSASDSPVVHDRDAHLHLLGGVVGIGGCHAEDVGDLGRVWDCMSAEYYSMA